jgi:hypothetical protein
MGGALAIRWGLSALYSLSVRYSGITLKRPNSRRLPAGRNFFSLLFFKNPLRPSAVCWSEKLSGRCTQNPYMPEKNHLRLLSLLCGLAVLLLHFTVYAASDDEALATIKM